MNVVNLRSLTLSIVLYWSRHDSLFEIGANAAAVAPTNSSPAIVPQSSSTLESPRINHTRSAIADAEATGEVEDAPVAQEHHRDGGPPAEEIALYVCIALGVLLFAVCCYFCSKHCWCPTTRRPVAGVYRHMTIPANVSIFTRQQDDTDAFGLLRPDVSPALMRHISPIRTENIVLATLPTLEELEILYKPQDGHERQRDPPPPYNHNETRNQAPNSS